MLPAREVLRERGNGRGRPGSPCGPAASLPAARSRCDPLASPEAFLAPSEGPPLRATLSLGEFSTAQACGAAGVGGTAIPPYSLGEPTRRPRGLGGGARPSPRSATFRGGGGACGRPVTRGPLGTVLSLRWWGEPCGFGRPASPCRSSPLPGTARGARAGVGRASCASPGRRGRQRALPSADQAEGRGPAPLGGLGRLSPVWPGSGVRAGVRPGKTEAAGSAAGVRPATGSSCPRRPRSR